MKRLAWAAVAVFIAGGCRHVPPPTDPFLRTTVPPPSTTQFAPPTTGDSYSGSGRSTGAGATSGSSTGGASTISPPTGAAPQTYQIPPKDKFAPAGGFHYQQGSVERNRSGEHLAATFSAQSDAEVERMLDDDRASNRSPPEATAAASLDDRTDSQLAQVDANEAPEEAPPRDRPVSETMPLDQGEARASIADAAEPAGGAEEISPTESVPQGLATADSPATLSPPSDQSTLRILSDQEAGGQDRRSAERALALSVQDSSRSTTAAPFWSQSASGDRDPSGPLKLASDLDRTQVIVRTALAGGTSETPSTLTANGDDLHAAPFDRQVVLATHIDRGARIRLEAASDSRPLAESEPWRAADRSGRPVAVTTERPDELAREDGFSPDGRAPPAAAVVERFAFDPRYEWLRGRLEYSHSRRQWKLRYIPIDGQTDRYGGSVVIANPGALDDARPGDLFEVHGTLVGDAKPARGFSPGYQLSAATKLSSAD